MHNFLPPNNIQARTTVAPGIPKAIEWFEHLASKLGVLGSNPGASAYFPSITNNHKIRAAIYSPHPMDSSFVRPRKPIFPCADHLQRW